MQDSLTRPTVTPVRSRAERDDAVRLGASATLWISLLLVAYWWVSGGGLQGLATPTEALTSTGRLSGLVASVLLLAQVVLMARVPLLESAFGQDRLARIHRWVGFGSFTLMVAHVVLITWGYGAGRLLRWLPTFWDLTWHAPGMLLADAGTAALFLVVGTSVRAARRRLRYESWHLMHLYAYLGVGLALPHQLWTGADFIGSPGRVVFWWSAWALAAATVLLWRVGLPVLRNLRHRLRVEAVVREENDIVSVHVTGRRLDRLPVEAGQFFGWRFLGRPGQMRSNPYSLSAAPDGRSLRITVQEVGDGSGSLASLRPGTRVWVEGPYGRLGERARTRDKVALIGAGVGITPLRALAESLAASDMVLLHRWTTTPLFAEELADLARRRPLTVLDLPGRRRSDGSWLSDVAGSAERVSDAWAVQYWVPDIAERDVYVCGPGAWGALVRDSLLVAGCAPDSIHLETFAW